MAAGEPYGGRVLIVDSSTWIKLPRAPEAAQKTFVSAVALGQIRCSPVVLIEILYGAEDAEAVEAERAALEELLPVPVTASVCRAAINAMVALAHSGSPGNHKVKGADLLIAASAADSAFGVLHHDEHFDKLASVLPFDSIWFADPDERTWSGCQET
ncbi:MAG: PIN domain-containing protein [Thermoleophilia bacterium]|nr:PIN domain-containing protein [Thermoleophilia bacterium]